MHPSTTAIITATEYTDGIFLQIHMFRFFMDLCFHWNACHEYYYFASLESFMHQQGSKLATNWSHTLLDFWLCA